MDRLRRATLAAALAASAVAAMPSCAQAQTQPTAPVVVATSFEPADVGFGDESTATVTILLDREAVRPETLRVSDDLGPLTQLGPATTSRTQAGELETVTVRIPVACLTDPCVTSTGLAAITLPRVRVSALARDGRVDTVATAWPRVRVHSRVSPSELAAVRPRFAVDTAPGAPAFRLSPLPLALALDVIAGVSAAGVLLLLLLELLGLRRLRRPVAGGLERARRLVREAEQRDAPDRRRALGLLARLLDVHDPALGRTADDLAWSEPSPDRERMNELLHRLERDAQP